MCWAMPLPSPALDARRLCWMAGWRDVRGHGSEVTVTDAVWARLGTAKYRTGLAVLECGRAASAEVTDTLGRFDRLTADHLYLYCIAALPY